MPRVRRLPPTLELTSMSLPKYHHFCIGAVLGACAAVWVRAVGALILNGSLDWSHISHFLFDSLLVPKLALFAIAAYVAVGTPVFIWARRRNKLTPWLFVVIGTVVGYLSSFPALLLPSWAVMYALAGLTGGFVGYAVMWFLANRSGGQSLKEARQS